VAVCESDKEKAKNVAAVVRGWENTLVKEICPRGNNNIVIIIFLVHDNVYKHTSEAETLILVWFINNTVSLVCLY
jgi:hypothetical protein